MDLLEMGLASHRFIMFSFQPFSLFAKVLVLLPGFLSHHPGLLHADVAALLEPAALAVLAS